MRQENRGQRVKVGRVEWRRLPRRSLTGQWVPDGKVDEFERRRRASELAEAVQSARSKSVRVGVGAAGQSDVREEEAGRARQEEVLQVRDCEDPRQSPVT